MIIIIAAMLVYGGTNEHGKIQSVISSAYGQDYLVFSTHVVD